MQTISISNLSHPTELALTCLAGFSLCLAVFPSYINWITKKQFKQFVREDGPKSHASKNQTPTTGGVVFTLMIPVVALIAWCSFGMKVEISYLLPLIVGLICGGIGFIDDYCKVSSKSNKGISGYLRLLTEFLAGIVIGLILVAFNQHIVYVPFAGFFQSLFGGTISSVATGQILSPWIPNPLFFALLSGCVVASTANAFNLHDGMDGLSAGTGCQVFAAMAIILSFYGGAFLPYAIVSACAAGALCAFLIFNKYPAKIFMGDTGSLFVGGLMGAIVVCSGMEVLFIPLALIYVVEALSVIAQVVYFKLTKKLEGEESLPFPKVVFTKLTKRLPGEGKRLFRMAPIHHHFEVVFQEKGVKEWQVVLMFWLVQALLAIVVVSLLFTLN